MDPSSRTVPPRDVCVRERVRGEASEIEDDLEKGSRDRDLFQVVCSESQEKSKRDRKREREEGEWRMSKAEEDPRIFFFLLYTRNTFSTPLIGTCESALTLKKGKNPEKLTNTS